MYNLNLIFRIFLLLFTFSFFFIFSANSYAESINQELSDSFLRLHILANSNSEEDQQLKYSIRDQLISYMDQLCQGLSSKDEALVIASAHLSDFEKIAQKTIQEKRFFLPCKG